MNFIYLKCYFKMIKTPWVPIIFLKYIQPKWVKYLGEHLSFWVFFTIKIFLFLIRKLTWALKYGKKGFWKFSHEINFFSFNNVHNIFSKHWHQTKTICSCSSLNSVGDMVIDCTQRPLAILLLHESTTKKIELNSCWSTCKWKI